MSSSAKGPRQPAPERGFVPTSALAKAIQFHKDAMSATFTDGRVLRVPLAWFPRLLHASTRQRTRCKIGGGGVSLHWPDLDEDLSIAGLMAGVDLQSG